MSAGYERRRKLKPRKLKSVVQEASQDLEKRRYAKTYRRSFELPWKCLVAYADSHGQQWWSETLIEGFLAQVEVFRETLPKTWFAEEGLNRALRVLREHHLYGCHEIKPAHVTLREPLPPFMEHDVTAVFDYLLQKERYSLRSILGAQEIRLRRFLKHLHDSGTVRWNQVTAERVLDYLGRFSRLHPNTRCAITNCFRRFFRGLYVLGRIRFALHEQIPQVRQRRGGIQSDIWPEDEVKCTLDAIDRDSVVGRRDYAILLLFARMGLRPVDVRELRLENIDWEAQVLEFTQSKTGRATRLPIPLDVAEALADYLKFGRPASEHREVFLIGHAPYSPLAWRNNFYAEIQRCRAKAGLPPRRHAGAQALRHTLATRMLAAGNPPAVIAGALGHRSLDSTTVYFRYDVENLRAVALEPEEEVRHA